MGRVRVGPVAAALLEPYHRRIRLQQTEQQEAQTSEEEVVVLVVVLAYSEL
jgi:hypothetical protein